MGSIASCRAALISFALVLPVVAAAGPGGKIASAAFQSTWGKVLLALLSLIFLPLIIYVAIAEWRAQRRTLAALASLGKRNPAFDWFTLKDRVTDSFQRVHSAWRREDMAEASAWMTDWYWQNQQLVHLDAWERDGLVNHCQVKKVRRMRPLALSCRNFDGQGGGSRVVVAVTALMEDYLAERSTGKVVEGKKGFKDVETVWTFVLEDGAWKVNNIEEDSMTLAYAKLSTDVEELLHPSGASSGPLPVHRPPPGGRLH